MAVSKCFQQPEVNGKIDNPSATDFVHCLFTSLAFVSLHHFHHLFYKSR